MAFQSDAFQADAFQNESSGVSPGLINQTAVAFAPTISFAQTVSVGLISQTAATFGPTVNLAGDSAFQYDAFQHDAFQTSDPGGGAQSVSVALIDRTAATFTPTVTATASISVALINQTATCFTPTVTSAGNVAIDYINQTASPYTPTVTTTASIVLGLINQTATPYAPAISAFVSLGLISQPATTFNPVVTPGAVVYTPALINQQASPFTPTVSSTASIVLGRIDQTAVGFAPSVASLLDWFVNNPAFAYAPVVQASQSVLLGRIGNLATIHAPLVQFLDQDVVLPLIDRTAVASAPTISPYTQNISVGLIVRTATAFQPTVALPAAKFITLPRINSTVNIFPPTVAIVEIILPLLDRTAHAFAPTLSGGLATQFIDFGGTSAPFSSGDFVDDKDAVETVVNPPLGTTTIEGFPASYTLDSDDPAVFDDWTNDGQRGNYSAWIKLVIDRPALMTFNTYGSSMEDTELFMFLQETAPTGSDTPFDISDDTAEDPYSGETPGRHWSALPDNPGNPGSAGYNADGTPYLYDPGTYWLCVFPFEGSGWATSEGSFVLNINVFDVDEPVSGFIDNTPSVFTPSVALLAQGLFFGTINRTAVAFTPTVTGGALLQNITFGRISNPATAYAPVVQRWAVPVITPAPPAGAPVRVVMGGAGGGGGGGSELTDGIVWHLTELVTAVSGNAQIGFITVRDVGQSVAEFPVGSRITIDLGPGTRPLWTGYLLRAARRHWFPVDYPDTMQRQWRLSVVDINVLFSRRIVYRKSDPANVNGTKYTALTWDDDALATLFADFLDLSADDLDLTTELQRVYYINPGPQTTYPYNAGMTMGEAVRNIAQIPAAVWGFNPSRQFVYADVDSENAPFVLTDEFFPAGRPANRVGYREATILPDGTQLVNDFLAWGAGKGDDHMVFHRRISDSSVAEHGLWQDSFFTAAVWKQATIEKITDSEINGSPGSRRGHKQDRYEIRCVIHEHGLVVGDRVRFRSTVWDYEDVIPVRKMTMTFPTPYDVRYELILSHEIDRWGFEDPIPPYPYPGIDVPQIDWPPPHIPIDEPCTTTDYPLDLFTRTASGSGPWSTVSPEDALTASAATEWGGSWIRDPDHIELPLSFPGTNDSSTGTTVNRVSAVLNPSVQLTNRAGLVVHFDSHDPGSGPGLETHGVLSPTTNQFRNAATGDYPIPFTTGVGGFVYYYFGGSYNSDLSGSGSVEYYEPQFGSSGDSAGVSAGVAFAQVTNGHWAAVLPYNPAGTATGGAFGNPISTGRFKIRFPSVPAGLGAGNLRIKYGPAEFYIVPSLATTALTLVTGSGATADSMPGMFSNVWYTVEILADLTSDSSTARIYDEAGTLLSSTTRSNAGEDPGDYTPRVGFRVESTTGSPFRFEVSLTESSAYSTGTTVADEFDLPVSPNDSGWGGDWVTRQGSGVLGPTPGVEWSVEDGVAKVELVDTSIDNGARIEQPVTGGSVDVKFQLMSYPIRASIMEVYFGSTGSTTNPKATLGTTTSLTQGTGSGATVSTSGAAIFDGGPVNVHLRWSVMGMKLWLWDASLEEEPSTPTLSIARTLPNPPAQLLWGYSFFFVNNGEQVLIGPIAEDEPVHAKVGSVDLSYGTGIVDVTHSLTGGANGRHREWPTADPGDGRDYGVAWNSDVWEVASGGPTYGAAVVYGQFGNLGPGADWTKSQTLLDVLLPRILDANGVEYDYDVIVEGEIGIGFGGGSTGSGEGFVLVPISTYDYGAAGLPTPSYTDDYISGNRVRTYVSAVAQEATTQYAHFKFTVHRSELGGPENQFGTPRYHLRWGVHTEGAWDILRAAGPWSIPFLPFFPLAGVLSINTRNVTYKLDLAGTPVIDLQPDPCPPFDFILEPAGGCQTNPSNAQRDSSTVYHVPGALPYVPGSLAVFVDGKVQRTGIDFTESDPTTGEFTFTSPVSSAAIVMVQYYSPG